MKFIDVESLTFLEWLRTVSPWMWCPKIAVMIYEIAHDPDFPNLSGYEYLESYLRIRRNADKDRLEGFDLLYGVYVAQTRGERWDKPNEGRESNVESNVHHL